MRSFAFDRCCFLEDAKWSDANKRHDECPKWKTHWFVADTKSVSIIHVRDICRTVVYLLLVSFTGVFVARDILCAQHSTQPIHNVFWWILKCHHNCVLTQYVRIQMCSDCKPRPMWVTIILRNSKPEPEINTFLSSSEEFCGCCCCMCCVYSGWRQTIRVWVGLHVTEHAYIYSHNEKLE